MYKDSVAVVTGAAGGIGEALCRDLVQRGARVAIVDLSLESTQALAADLGQGARGYACDVTDLSQVEALAQAVRADGMRRDLDDTGVGVSILCPGVVATRIWDARRTRPDRFGGAASMPADFAERADKAMQAQGFSPQWTARQTLDAVERGEFIIITDPRIRLVAEPRHAAVAAALDRCDERDRERISRGEPAQVE